MKAAAASAYPVVPVFHPRREARRAVKRGYPRGSGSVRLCRSVQAVKQLSPEQVQYVKGYADALENVVLR